MVKVIAWYDNEYGYANRLVEEVMMLGQNQMTAPVPVSAETPQPAPQPTL
jgi:hypothetical protein